MNDCLKNIMKFSKKLLKIKVIKIYEKYFCISHRYLFYVDFPVHLYVHPTDKISDRTI